MKEIEQKAESTHTLDQFYWYRVNFFSPSFFLFLLKLNMTEDFVEWDVHATTDVHSPRVEYNDPLTQFSESEVCA